MVRTTISDTHHNQQHKIYPIPKTVCVLNIIHNVSPSLEWYDLVYEQTLKITAINFNSTATYQKYSDPGQSDVVERYRPLEGIIPKLSTVGVILIPVDAGTRCGYIVRKRHGRCWNINRLKVELKSRKHIFYHCKPVALSGRVEGCYTDAFPSRPASSRCSPAPLKTRSKMICCRWTNREFNVPIKYASTQLDTELGESYLGTCSWDLDYR